MSMNVWQTVLIASVLFLIGAAIVKRVGFLKRYCIPAPLVGGLIFAIANTVLYVTDKPYFEFNGTIQTILMIVFFTTVGFTARIPLLKKGGQAVTLCLILASVLTLLQNALGVGVLMAFGEDPRLGLAVGSISLVGGPGTAAAFGPVLEQAGAAGGSVVGISSATFGLIMGSLLGGPAAHWLIRKYKITGRARLLEEAAAETLTGSRITVPRVLSISCIIAFCVFVGTVLSECFTLLTGITMPSYIGGMVVAAIFRNTTEMTDEEFPDREADIIGNVSLSGFLTMAMMSLRIWELADLAGPVVVALALQTVMLIVFSYALFFPRLGGDYDAAVMTAGFIGFSMGATSNAMANMQAVTKEYGPSPTSFLVIPVVGGMFIDFVNVIVIGLLIPALGVLA